MMISNWKTLWSPVFIQKHFSAFSMLRVISQTLTQHLTSPGSTSQFVWTFRWRDLHSERAHSLRALRRFSDVRGRVARRRCWSDAGPSSHRVCPTMTQTVNLSCQARWGRRPLLSREHTAGRGEIARKGQPLGANSGAKSINRRRMVFTGWPNNTGRGPIWVTRIITASKAMGFITESSHVVSFAKTQPPANTNPLHNIYTMLGQRLRRWPNIV